jgi:hypothetical protein
MVIAGSSNAHYAEGMVNSLQVCIENLPIGLIHWILNGIQDNQVQVQ